MLQNATLKGSSMNPEDIERLRNPTESLPCVDAEIVDLHELEAAFIHSLCDAQRLPNLSKSVYQDI